MIPLGAKNDPIWSAIGYTSATAFYAAFPGTSAQSLGCNAGAPTADLSKQPTCGHPDEGGQADANIVKSAVATDAIYR